jgi:hypothetical protein
MTNRVARRNWTYVWFSLPGRGLARSRASIIVDAKHP